MHRFGVYALTLGAVFTVVGLFAGFGLMFSGRDEPAKLFLAMVPVGFLIGFTGVVATLFSGPGSDDHP